jgi:hypothetical protein
MPTTSAASKNHSDGIIIIEDQGVVQKIEACLVDLTLSPRYPMLRLRTAWRPRICEAVSTDRLL